MTNGPFPEGVIGDDAGRILMLARRPAVHLIRFLVALGLCAAAAGCIQEAPGTVVAGVNESDRDVIVASSLHGRSLVLPARTRGKLFDSYSTPSGELTVFDEQCRALGTLPLTRTLDTLRIGPAGEIELTGSALKVVGR
jgi:hypothetical protein